MNIKDPKQLIRFFSTPSGRLVGFVGLVFLALMLTRGCRRSAGSKAEMAKAGPSASPVESNHRPLSPLGPAPAGGTNPPLPGLTIHGGASPQGGVSADFAPYGSIIPITLVQAIESANAETPLIALTTEDLCHLKRLILPKDSLIHGRIRPGRTGDRIHSENTFVLVWPTGEQLTVTGLLLNQNRLPTGGWGADDGVAGIRGQLIRSDNWAELKLFVSTFLSAAAQTVEERQSTITGPSVLPSAKNASLQGSSAVLDRYAAQLVERTVQEAYLVRVPAGKSGFVYVTEVIDRNQARVGGRSLPQTSLAQPSSPPPQTRY